MAEPNTDDLVELGEVMGAHGVRGELKVKVHNPDSDLLLDLPRLWICHGGAPRSCEVESARPHGKGLVMTLAGVRDREQARELFGAQLCVPRDMLPEPDEDEFYLVDAIGTAAVDPDGKPMGEVVGFRAYPSVDVLCVKGPDGVREVPLLPQYFVGADLERNIVTVDNLADIEPEPGSGKGDG